MNIPLDEVLFFDAITSTPFTGAAVDADSPPTFAVYEEATDTDIGIGGSMTKRTALTGNYRGTFTASVANGFEVGKWYSIVASATVGGVVGKAVLRNFRIVAAETVAGTPEATPTTASKTGYALAATGADLILKTSTFALAMADAVWDEALSAHDTEDSIGNVLNDLTEESGTYRFTALALAQAPTGATASYTIGAATAGEVGKIDWLTYQNKRFRDHNNGAAFTVTSRYALTGKAMKLLLSEKPGDAPLLTISSTSGEITVGGTGDLTVSIDAAATNTATVGTFAIALINTTDNDPIASGWVENVAMSSST